MKTDRKVHEPPEFIKVKISKTFNGVIYEGSAFEQNVSVAADDEIELLNEVATYLIIHGYADPPFDWVSHEPYLPRPSK